MNSLITKIELKLVILDNSKVKLIPISISRIISKKK